MGLILGLIAAFIVGAAMVELGFTDPDFELASRIFTIICGGILMLPGVLFFPSLIKEIKKTRREKKNEKTKESKINLFRFIVLLKNEPVSGEESFRAKNITSFRKAYRNFFNAEYLEKNTDLQNEATQLHWNILALQKRRLEKKKIRMDFDAVRMEYGAYPNYTENSYFDGKYNITEVSETMEAKKKFYKGSRLIGSDKCSKLAQFVLLDPQTNRKGLVTCPNCGSVSTRENLLDGCDYCGTKFTVEDLEERVSDFSFGHDYDLTYAQYVDARSRFTIWVGLIVGIPISIFSIWGAVSAILGGAADGTGPVMKITVFLLIVAFVTFAVVYLSLVFFYFFVFPVVQLIASVLHLTGKNMDALKKAKLKDLDIEALIRKDDPLFSRKGFYAHLQNILATIFMGDSNDEILTFSEGDYTERAILGKKESFRDIINVSTDWMRLDSYSITDGMSNIVVEGNIVLTKETNGRVRRKKHYIKLQAVREADLKTAAVAGPSFTRCGGCGNAMSILSGKKCEYCGRLRKISSIDWALANFHISR